jgi:hypothetical protein
MPLVRVNVYRKSGLMLDTARPLVASGPFGLRVEDVASLVQQIEVQRRRYWALVAKFAVVRGESSPKQIRPVSG